jgi:diguanylate cyclase (GGDEF)-like protein
MSEPTRRETQLGLADFKKRLNAASLNIVEQHANFRSTSIYFAIGNARCQTNIVVSEQFLDDLPNTEEYRAMVDSYACAVAGRLQCGSPDIFYCQSGVAFEISFRWPIESGVYNNQLRVFLLTDVTIKPDGRIAKCSMSVGEGRVFTTVVEAVNSVRSAIDFGQIKFYEPGEHQQFYQDVERKRQPQERRSQQEVEHFLTGKAYTLGFTAVDKESDVWAADPWDALYLGVAERDLALAMRVLKANGLVQAGTGSDCVRPTDKLLAERSSRGKEDETFSTSQQKLSRTSLPNKDDLLKDMPKILKNHPTFALIVVDLDNFKNVNDTKGHSEGDACLDKVVATIGAVVGRKGKIYRWGGDEFAICLPDFSTTEAHATAQRIRLAVQQAKPGCEIAVTTSIGVCGNDCTEFESPEELLDFADKAMYESKRNGKNRVTSWPLPASDGS